MENYKHASEAAQDMIFKFLKDRMKEKKMSQKDLCKILSVSTTTFIRYFKKETPMPLGVLLEILGALQVRPYFIAAEDDNTEMQRMFFN